MKKVHLVGFIIKKFVTMHGDMNVKKGVGFSIPELQSIVVEFWHTKFPIFLNNSQPLYCEVSSFSESSLNIVE